MLTEHGSEKAIKKTKLVMKNVKEIICIKIAVAENKPMKIKSISVETDDIKKQRV